MQIPQAGIPFFSSGEGQGLLAEITLSRSPPPGGIRGPLFGSILGSKFFLALHQKKHPPNPRLLQRPQGPWSPLNVCCDSLPSTKATIHVWVWQVMMRLAVGQANIVWDAEIFPVQWDGDSKRFFAKERNKAQTQPARTKYARQQRMCGNAVSSSLEHSKAGK